MNKKWISLWTSLAFLSTALIRPFAASPPQVVCQPQMGQVVVTIPAGETQGLVATPINFCPKINVQLTGGSSGQLPIILNAKLHQGFLITTAHLLNPEEGPVDVVIWWQVTFGK